MTTRCSNGPVASMTGALMTLAAIILVASSTARAACPSVGVTNNTSCAVTMYFLCPGLPAIGPITVGPMSFVPVPIPAGCTPTAVPIICGNRRLLTTGCIFNVSVAPGCCATVCYDPVACTLVYTPTLGPCPC